MRCSEISILLATRRDLSAAEESAVRAHLNDCSSCAAAWSGEERTTRVLRALSLPPVKQPPTWVEEEIQAMLQHKLSPHLRRRWRYGLALAGVALVALVLFLLPIGASTNSVPRLSPLDGRYQPGSLSAPQDDLQLTPTTDGQAPWHFYMATSPYFDAPQDDWHTKIVDPESGAELLILEHVTDVVLSPDGSQLYAGVPGYVLALDPQTKQKRWQVELKHNFGWAGESPWPPPSKLAISHDGRLLYIFIGDEIGNRSYVLRTIDTQTAQLLPQRMITPEKYFEGNCPVLEMLTPSVGDWIYIVCSTGVYRGTITAQDLEEITVPDDSLVDAILSGDRSKLYVLSRHRKISIIDAATNTIERTITLDIAAEELLNFERGRLALSGDGSRLVIGNRSGDTDESDILIVDTSTWQTVKRLHLNLYIADYTLYMNEDGRRIYFVTHDPNLEDRRLDPLNTIAEIDSDTGQLIKAHTFPKRQIEKLLRGP